MHLKTSTESYCGRSVIKEAGDGIRVACLLALCALRWCLRADFLASPRLPEIGLEEAAEATRRIDDHAELCPVVAFHETLLMVWRGFRTNALEEQPEHSLI